MHKSTPILALTLLLASASLSLASEDETIKWSDVNFINGTNWIYVEDSKAEVYYSLEDAYKVVLEKSSNDAIVYFKDSDQTLRIDFGKINAKQKFQNLLRRLNVNKGN